MKRWSTLSHRAERAAPAVLLGLLLATGCVTRSTHNQVVGALETEVSKLENRVRDLERSNKALDAERVALVDEMEDLRQERQVLTSDVEKLSKTKELLSEHLRKRESEVEELSKLKTTYRGLVDDLESEVAAGQIQIEQLREGIRLNLAQDILFRSGSSKLEGSGVAVLRKVAKQLREMTHTVEVQGHTDDVPLSAALAARYGTNWELAAARASSVVRLFEEEKVDPSRLSAVSYGEFAPIASNDTPEGRARNRRIEIRLIPVEALAPAAPGAAPEGAAPEGAAQAPADGVSAGGDSAAAQ
jgi:chemotaxis protein MotB